MHLVWYSSWWLIADTIGAGERSNTWFDWCGLRVSSVYWSYMSPRDKQLPFSATPRSLKGSLLFRRKRLYIAIVTIFGLFWMFTRWTTFPSDSSSKVPLEPVNELDGLLYMVSHTSTVLPRDLDPREPLKSSLWSTPRGRWSAALQKREVIEALKKTPVIVFSKTYCPLVISFYFP